MLIHLCIYWEPCCHIRPVTNIHVEKQFLVAACSARQTSMTCKELTWPLSQNLSFESIHFVNQMRTPPGVTFTSLWDSSLTPRSPRYPLKGPTCWNVIVSLSGRTSRCLLSFNRSSTKRTPHTKSLVLESFLLRGSWFPSSFEELKLAPIITWHSLVFCGGNLSCDFTA